MRIFKTTIRANNLASRYIFANGIFTITSASYLKL
nr:MAG TPA: hypothetical protein [Bacteriophage sp.]